METKYVKAKKRVDQLKGFYNHFAFYAVINGFFICRRIYNDISNGDSFLEAFTEISNYRLFFWWGLILIFHGINVYKFNFLGKKWEERKLKEIIGKEERNSKL